MDPDSQRNWRQGERIDAVSLDLPDAFSQQRLNESGQGQHILECLPTPIALVSYEGRIELTNSHFAEIFGRSGLKLEGSRLTDILRSADLKSFRRWQREFSHGSAKIWRGQLRPADPAHKARGFFATLYPLPQQKSFLAILERQSARPSQAKRQHYQILAAISRLARMLHGSEFDLFLRQFVQDVRDIFPEAALAVVLRRPDTIIISANPAATGQQPVAREIGDLGQAELEKILDEFAGRDRRERLSSSTQAFADFLFAQHVADYHFFPVREENQLVGGWCLGWAGRKNALAIDGEAAAALSDLLMAKVRMQSPPPAAAISPPAAEAASRPAIPVQPATALSAEVLTPVCASLSMALRARAAGCQVFRDGVEIARVLGGASDANKGYLPHWLPAFLAAEEPGRVSRRHISPDLFDARALEYWKKCATMQFLTSIQPGFPGEIYLWSFFPTDGELSARLEETFQGCVQALMLLHQRTAAGEGHSGYRLLENVLASYPDALFSTNRRGVVTYFNNGAERLLGYGQKEILGDPLMRLLCAEKLKLPGSCAMCGSTMRSSTLKRRCGTKTAVPFLSTCPLPRSLMPPAPWRAF